MIETLIHDLAHPDPWVRICASITLRDTAHAALGALCAVVRDQDAPFERRWRAIDLLGEAGDARAMTALLDATGDSSLDLRQHAVLALGCIGSDAAFAELATLLTDPDEEGELRFVSARALTRLDAARALPYLRRALQGSEAQQRAAHAMLAALDEQDKAA